MTMLKRHQPETAESSSKADLDEMDAHLARLLPLVLLGRFHSDVLRRWAYLRFCVASALEGEYMESRETMHFAVQDLAAVVEHRFGTA